MIQRIQSLYMLLVVVLGAVMCCYAPVEFLAADGVEYIKMMPFDKWPMGCICAIIPSLALVNIFLFKKRLLQGRLNIVNAVFCLGYYCLLALYTWYVVKGYEPIGDVHLQGAEWYLTIWAGMPLVCLVLSMMATRRIWQDEALVRAADRIR